MAKMDIRDAVIMPPVRGSCPVCACVHREDEPHNRESLYYQMKFRQENGRFPTWKDATAHCTPQVRAAFKEAMRRYGIIIETD